MSTYPTYVAERLAHGALCHICPLNGQRKVGHDGPADAQVIVVAEAPGVDEEEWGMAWGLKEGKPLVGKSGWFFKIRYLVANGLAVLRKYLRKDGTTGETIDVTGAHLMNVAMCRPPKNKIESKEGKQAVRCCANSARWFLNERLREDPNRTLVPMGATALSLMRGETTPIEPYRGRPTGPYIDLQFPYEDELSIYKYVLKGRKVEQAWVRTQLYVIDRLVKTQVAGLRKAVKQREKDETPMYAVVLGILLDRQGKALRKRAKSEILS